MFLLPLHSPVAYASSPVFATSSAEQYIRAEATFDGMSEQETNALVKTLYCESGLNPERVGKLGELGIAQIYLPAHPDITAVQARDPVWSIQWTIRQFLAGRAHWWSCYNILHLSLSDRE